MNRRKVVNARAGERRPERGRWLYGVNAVARRLEMQPASIRELHVVGGQTPRRTQLCALAQRAGIPVRDADAAGLRQLTGSDAHQGVAALAEAFRYADLDAVLSDQSGPVLLLDQIQDPHNLGALIRTAAAVGMAAVIVPRHGAAPISAAVEKVAAGAVNDVPICETANLHRCLLDLRELGYWSVALSAGADQNLFSLDVPARPALVVGGESGLRALVEQTCDFRAAIPLQAGVESLNASVAGAIAMYEVARRLGRL